MLDVVEEAEGTEFVRGGEESREGSPGGGDCTSKSAGDSGGEEGDSRGDSRGDSGSSSGLLSAAMAMRRAGVGSDDELG